MSTGERLQQFLDSIDLSTYRFEVEAGLSISSASRVIQGKQEFSTANLLRIHTRYPELNLDWFLTGRGEMPVDLEETPQQKITYSDQLEKVIRAIEQKLKLSRDQEQKARVIRESIEEELTLLKSEVSLYRRYIRKASKLATVTVEIE